MHDSGAAWKCRTMALLHHKCCLPACLLPHHKCFVLNMTASDAHGHVCHMTYIPKVSAQCCIILHLLIGRRHTCMCCRRYTAGKRKGSSHVSPAKRMALSQEVPVTCGSSSGVYDIRRGCVSLRAAQHGQVCLPLCLFFILLHCGLL